MQVAGAPGDARAVDSAAKRRAVFTGCNKRPVCFVAGRKRSIRPDRDNRCRRIEWTSDGVGTGGSAAVADRYANRQ